jgi:hypothetical protein
MYAPQLYETERSRETTQEFLGYNHNLRIGDNEFYDMRNLTGKHYPVLSPRARRGKTNYQAGDGTVNGILAKEHLSYVNGPYLQYNGHDIYLPLGSDVERQLVSMGAYIIVFPDMYYLNTATGESGYCYTERFMESNNKSSYQMFGEDGAPLSVADIMWDEYFHLKTNIYVDPSSNEQYLIHGIPKTGSGFSAGGYNITFSSDIEMYLGHNDNNELFTVTDTPYGSGMYLTPTEDSDGKATIIETIREQCAKGLTPKLCRIKITAEIERDGKSMTIPREVFLCAGIDENGKFRRHSILVGDRKMKFTDSGEIKSQICVYVDETDSKTYYNESCWRDEATMVRIKVGEYFVNKLREVFDNGESHVITLYPPASMSGFPFAGNSLFIKYGTDTFEIGSNVAKIVSGEYIDLQGFLDFYDTTAPTAGEIGIAATPKPYKFDYVIESNNRLWACRYGTDYKGDFVNEIYASARGSFRAWDVYKGTADDSYAVSLGSDGPFTGAVNFKGIPMFFKENSCHSIYGAYPSSYQLVTDTGTWVASGSHKSIVPISNALYFHGRDGVYRYDGASLEMISNALGGEIYSHAVAGECDRRYYVSMRGRDGAYTLFVYDTTKGLWHKEDSTKIVHCATYNGDLYFSCGDYSNGFDPIYTVNGTDGEKEQDVEWEAETGRIGFVYPNHQYIGKLQLRMILPVGSTINLFVEYDSDGYWEFIGGAEGKNASSFSVPIMPRRCDHFRIKLAGRGECKIFSLTKTLEQGGEE